MLFRSPALSEHDGLTPDYANDGFKSQLLIAVSFLSFDASRFEGDAGCAQEDRTEFVSNAFDTGGASIEMTHPMENDRILNLYDLDQSISDLMERLIPRVGKGVLAPSLIWWN